MGCSGPGVSKPQQHGLLDGRYLHSRLRRSPQAERGYPSPGQDLQTPRTHWRRAGYYSDHRHYYMHHWVMETFPGCLHRCPCYLETHLSFAVTLVDETVTPGAFSKSSLHISACRTIVYGLTKDRRIQNYTLSCSLTSPDVLFLYNYCIFLN